VEEARDELELEAHQVQLIVTTLKIRSINLQL
jgi:hypothetical protein